jgi:nucleotide-binding universal stress UspA family protein
MRRRGSRSRDGIDDMTLGSVAQAVLHHAPARSDWSA